MCLVRFFFHQLKAERKKALAVAVMQKKKKAKKKFFLVASLEKGFKVWTVNIPMMHFSLNSWMYLPSFRKKENSFFSVYLFISFFNKTPKRIAPLLDDFDSVDVQKHVFRAKNLLKDPELWSAQVDNDRLWVFFFFISWLLMLTWDLW